MTATRGRSRGSAHSSRHERGKGDQAEPSFQPAILIEIDESELALDEGAMSRLPLHTAFPLVLLLSVACWAILLTAMLGLDRLAGGEIGTLPKAPVARRAHLATGRRRGGGRVSGPRARRREGDGGRVRDLGRVVRLRRAPRNTLTGEILDGL